MNPESALTEREQLILQAVVHTYITTAEAVGSRSIVKRFGLDVSPATVRNVMADLEEAGYLEQLHTSSGRVPTDRGYRYFVDYLMGDQELTEAERARIERDMSQPSDDAEEVMRQASHLLALVTRQTGLVEAPAEAEATVLRIEIVPIVANRVAVMIADSYGRVRTVTVTLQEPMSDERIAAVNQFLNEQLRSVAFNQLMETVENRLASFYDERHAIALEAQRVLALMPALRSAQMFLEGATQLFEYPEFRDITKAQEVFTLLEERSRLYELLRARMLQDGQPRLVIVIGSEAGEQALEAISLVAAPYLVGERIVGMLGVLGPRRMPYARLTAVVRFTAGSLGRHLTRLAG